MKNRTKMISMLVAVCMMITLLPAVALAAGESQFEVTPLAGSGPFGNDSAGVDFNNSGTYIIKNKPGVETTSNTITVNADNVTLIFDGVHISNPRDNAIELYNSVSIYLKGTNSLFGYGNGISAESNSEAESTVSFYDYEHDSAIGSITIEGTGDGIHGHAIINGGIITCTGKGAGIDGNVTVNSGSLTCNGTDVYYDDGNGIKGDIVTVNGGSLTCNGTCNGIKGNVIITGGSVYSKGTDNTKDYNDQRSGNGNGANGVDGTVTMSGGTLTAYASDTYFDNALPSLYFPGIIGAITFEGGYITNPPTIKAGLTPESATAVSGFNSRETLNQKYVTIGTGTGGTGGGTTGGSTPTPTPTPSTSPDTTDPGNTNPTPTPTPTPGSAPGTVDPGTSSGISLWYNGGNSFGSSNSAVPTSVEIDGVPVSFNGNGREFTVGCISPNAKWVTVNWNSTSVTTNFTPDANATCAEITLPKTGDVSVMAFALMAVVAAAGAMGKK